MSLLSKQPGKRFTPLGRILLVLGVIGLVGGIANISHTDPPPATQQLTVATAAAETADVAVETKQEATTESIPFDTQTIDDTSLNKGVTQVAQDGHDGVKTLTYTVTYTNGEETGRDLVSTDVTTQPISKIVHNGTHVAQASNCNPNYSGCVPNVSYDLDCADIRHTVLVTGTDVYRLDADHDGYGCESYGY
jgi:hypothetical protein